MDTTRDSFINRQIPHIEQITQNDCGIACFKMALKYFKKEDDLKNLEELILKLKINGISLWTIDIAHLCALNSLKHDMYTVTWGVTEDYQTEEFYTYDNKFKLEQTRINQLFESHSSRNIHVEVKSVELETIRGEIAKGNVCIVLVDASKLCGQSVDDNNESFPVELEERSQVMSCFRFLASENKCQANSNYMGHFIVLIGYDHEKRLMFYRNPAHTMKLSYTNYDSFEEARKSFGTDQDILFIYR